MPERLKNKQSKERPWFQDKRKNYASQALLREIHGMEGIFDVRNPTRFYLPKSDWDKNNFVLVTKEIYLSQEIAMACSPKIDSFRTYGLAWFIKFSMAESPHICEETTVWKMVVLYPHRYTKDDKAVINVGLAHLPRQKHYSAGSKDHILSGLETADFGEGSFFHPCYYLHGKSAPEKTALAHAGQAIIWLRSRLYADKNNISMPGY